MGSTPQQLAPILASTLVTISNGLNAAAINEYNQAMTLYTKLFGVNPPSSAYPKPVPPQIQVVNTTLVEQLEVQIPFPTEAEWAGIYSYQTYIPPPLPTPVIPEPTTVVEPFGAGFPNYFELAPDSPSVSVGTKVTINGIVYIKEVVSQSPFAPNGQVTAWKEQ
jgi:hypothetical protein